MNESNHPHKGSLLKATYRVFPHLYREKAFSRINQISLHTHSKRTILILRSILLCCSYYLFYDLVVVVFLTCKKNHSSVYLLSIQGACTITASIPNKRIDHKCMTKSPKTTIMCINFKITNIRLLFKSTITLYY